MARRDKVVMALLLGAGLRYGKAIGKPELAPHDTRRTYYAQLDNEAGVDKAKLSCPLGHSSVSVMQRYMNLELDMEVTASDFVPL
jgi:integrase